MVVFFFYDTFIFWHMCIDYQTLLVKKSKKLELNMCFKGVFYASTGLKVPVIEQTPKWLILKEIKCDITRGKGKLWKHADLI